MRTSRHKEGKYLSIASECQSKNRGQMTPEVHFTVLLSIGREVLEEGVGRKSGGRGR